MVDASYIIPAMYAQEKGPIAKAVLNAATNPEKEQQITEQTTAEHLKKQGEQLNEQSNIGEKEGDAAGNAFYYFNANNTEQENEKPVQENPLVGNLVNVKI